MMSYYSSNTQEGKYASSSVTNTHTHISMSPIRTPIDPIGSGKQPTNNNWRPKKMVIMAYGGLDGTHKGLVHIKIGDITSNLTHTIDVDMTKSMNMTR